MYSTFVPTSKALAHTSILEIDVYCVDHGMNNIAPIVTSPKVNPTTELLSTLFQFFNRTLSFSKHQGRVVLKVQGLFLLTTFITYYLTLLKLIIN